MKSVTDLAMAMCLGFLLAGCGDRDPANPQGDAATAQVPGTYVLDGEDYARALLADGEAFERGQAQPATLEERLAAMRARVAEQAAAKQVTLVLAEKDRGFLLRDVSSETEGSVRGIWELNDKDLTLRVSEIGTQVILNAPPLQATWHGDHLIMKKSQGIPFDHRLVRSSDDQTLPRATDEGGAQK